jgi:hypothetical protein
MLRKRGKLCRPQLWCWSGAGFEGRLWRHILLKFSMLQERCILQRFQVRQGLPEDFPETLRCRYMQKAAVLRERSNMRRTQLPCGLREDFPGGMQRHDVQGLTVLREGSFLFRLRLQSWFRQGV